MPLRHILEYDEADLRDLMGDLDTIGHMKKWRGTLWAHFNTYKLSSDYWSTFPVIVCFLETDPFYGTGDEDKDKAIMLQKIQRGEFKRPRHPDARSWSSLQTGNKAASDLMEKRSIQSLSKSCSTIDELLQKMKEDLVRTQKYSLSGQLNKTRYLYSEEAASTVLIYGFIGPEESPYLTTGELSLPFEKGSGINYYTE
jgi:hypothetical protein